MMTTRHTVRIPDVVGPHDVWTQEAVESLIGQEPRFTINFDQSAVPLARTKVVAARLDGTDLVLTLEATYPDDNAAQMARLLPEGEQVPPVSIGYTATPLQVREVTHLGWVSGGRSGNFPRPGAPARPAELRQSDPHAPTAPETAPRASFVCPVCGAESWNPNDVLYGYCGRCHAFTGENGALI